MRSMTEFVTLFKDFIYTLVALSLAYAGYSVFDRYMERAERKEIMKSIADAHTTAVTSMMGIHSTSTVKEAIQKEEDKTTASK